MRDVFPDLDRWTRRGEVVALATVVEVWGSAPRPVGAKMGIAAGGELTGSVSGGCVEGAVVEEARQVLAGGPPRLLRFGVTDEQAWSVGLSCGGKIAVFVERLDPALLAALAPAFAGGRPLAVATAIGGPAVGGHLVLDATGPRGAEPQAAELASPLPAALAAEVAAVAPALLTAQRNELRELGPAAEPVLIEVLAPPPRLVIVGAVHTAVALVELGRTLGYRTEVVDPRRAFASPERFARADALVVDWPDAALPRLGLDESTAVVLLSHDLKIDLPALEVALRSPARYIGALGSQKTHAKRLAALAEAGFSPAEVARIQAPVGLPLGGRSPEEIALAVMAEIVALRYGVQMRRQA